jgi:hypothetical protein
MSSFEAVSEIEDNKPGKSRPAKGLRESRVRGNKCFVSPLAIPR